MKNKPRHLVSLALHVLMLFSLPVALAVVTTNYFGLLSKYPQLQLEPSATTPLVVESLNITDMEGREKDVFEEGETVQVEMFLRASAEVARKLELRLECRVYGPQGEAVQTQSQGMDLASGQISILTFGFTLPNDAMAGQYGLEVDFFRADTGGQVSPTRRLFFTVQTIE